MESTILTKEQLEKRANQFYSDPVIIKLHEQLKNLHEFSSMEYIASTGTIIYDNQLYIDKVLQDLEKYTKDNYLDLIPINND